ncbi:MAG TPA: heme ABC exporter ATP-binding protein CcmA [Terriglobia bacterium]|nr:heme ABC exporter ATP-binding protein CcmA [Terriglobia bacterium]
MPPDTSPPARVGLELRNVSKYFGDLTALAGADLLVAPGETILLYGPNGAGKTTLLRLLATVARPSEGEVLLDGENVHRHPAAAKAAIGFVSHTTFLYGDLTVRENLKFFGTLFALPRVEKKIAAALELFRLGDWAHTPVRKLSRGLQQRVSLARALLHEPQFLLLDEPFTGLDAATVDTLESLMPQLSAHGKAVVFSTHDFERGAALARRLVTLEAGRIRYDGPVGSR